MTGCGETDERTAAYIHGAVAVLYAVMLFWHSLSIIRHWQRR